MSNVTVRELDPSRKADFLSFFDHAAFTDNPDWSDCYCSLYHYTHGGKEDSRRKAAELVTEGKIRGFLAYADGDPVPIGWCNAADRMNYPALQWLMGPGPGPDLWERVGAIVCFVVAAPHRNRGVASLLLDAACQKFSRDGLTWAEAYPVKHPESAAFSFPGPLSMFLKAGFATHRDAGWYAVVRKRLKPA